MNADGATPVRLTTNLAVDDFPDWSPDGGSIAFTSDRDGNGEVYGMSADGTGQARLTTTEGMWMSRPSSRARWWRAHIPRSQRSASTCDGCPRTGLTYPKTRRQGDRGRQDA